jgi:uncharacterized protein YdcH (DUF465 family)
MTVTELWRHYDNMMEKADHVQHLIYDLEGERGDLLAAAAETLKAIKAIDGVVDEE